MMTTGEMLGYTVRFNRIMEAKTSSYIKSRSLADMMSELEGRYQISMFPELNKKIEREQPWVMQLYRTVSDAREL